MMVVRNVNLVLLNSEDHKLDQLVAVKILSIEIQLQQLNHVFVQVKIVQVQLTRDLRAIELQYQAKISMIKWALVKACKSLMPQG